MVFVLGLAGWEEEGEMIGRKKAEVIRLPAYKFT